jgi:non-ribosomal peptide synthase protein (TIGR01720 family)
VPVDFAEAAAGHPWGSVRDVTFVLTRETTHQLVHHVPAHYGATLEGVLLTALAWALRSVTGFATPCIALERHGRDRTLVDGVDLSRTVGWFTAVVPVRLSIGPCASPEATLPTVCDQLSAALTLADSPMAGCGDDVPEPHVTFNYHGEIDSAIASASWFGLASEDKGPARAPDMVRRIAFGVTCVVAGGRLHTTVQYSTCVHRRSTIERLARAFEDALTGLASVQLVHATASAAEGPLVPGWLRPDDLAGALAEIAFEESDAS